MCIRYHTTKITSGTVWRLRKRNSPRTSSRSPGGKRSERPSETKPPGATTQRPGLQSALAAAEAGRFDVLLVHRVDRLSRSLRDLAEILDRLDAGDTAFRSATEPFDTSTPVGRVLVQMLGVVAQFERETIIDRVINGTERKAARGQWCGGYRPSATSRPAPRRRPSRR
ncbi:recombinase family protein [Streptomyces sp. 3N207]|uniref:recombinase family protein n=1 Tax=Streptomyces sp. 3N207 TaxID=3457417 RepID=UPI003FD2049A